MGQSDRDAARRQAKDAIEDWCRMGLDLKELASRAIVKQPTLSHLRNTPEYIVGVGLCQRVVGAVNDEKATRIEAMRMHVVGFCHGGSFAYSARDTARNRRLVEKIKKALARRVVDAKDVLPSGDDAALLRIGGDTSPLFLCVLRETNSIEERLALAHELEHLRQLILGRIPPESPQPPRSAF
jgi:hypothetical protein